MNIFHIYEKVICCKSMGGRNFDICEKMISHVPSAQEKMWLGVYAHVVDVGEGIKQGYL